MQSQCNQSLVEKGYTSLVYSVLELQRRIPLHTMQARAITALGCLGDIVGGGGVHMTSLRWWSWITMGTDCCLTHIISAYLLDKPGKNSCGQTIWEQQKCYLPSLCDFCYPSTIFVSDLLTLIATCRHHGKEFILAIDASQDAYFGKLATALSSRQYTFAW